MSEKTTKPTFEDKIQIIDREIQKRKGKWMLNSLAYLDYDDISQILRTHVYTKWFLWDSNYPLEQWLNKVITHQLINLVRDHYGRVAPPCNGCPHNISEDFCSYTQSGEKCNECPLFKRWQTKGRQVGYNLKLASSIDSEDFTELVFSSVSFGDNIDYERSSSRLHVEMKKILSKSQYKIYDLLVIQSLPEREVAKRLKLKSNEKGRAPGYKHLTDMKNKFFELAKKIIEEKEIL